jgi:hypothetical protein
VVTLCREFWSVAVGPGICSCILLGRDCWLYRSQSLNIVVVDSIYQLLQLVRAYGLEGVTEVEVPVELKEERDEGRKR